MTFVTAVGCRTQLEQLTMLLVSAFPGSTVYQHTELCRAMHDALRNKVDAVFWEAETGKAKGQDFIKTLRRQKPNVPVFIISKTVVEAEVADANGYFVLPESERQLLDAVRAAKTKEMR